MHPSHVGPIHLSGWKHCALVDAWCHRNATGMEYGQGMSGRVIVGAFIADPGSCCYVLFLLGPLWGIEDLPFSDKLNNQTWSINSYEKDMLLEKFLRNKMLVTTNINLRKADQSKSPYMLVEMGIKQHVCHVILVFDQVWTWGNLLVSGRQINGFASPIIFETTTQ